ncbi:hypothetical protein GOODEAATRI_033404 [Goodea atripinnis]|uniref:Uncharacterized protein n=1 Tax=Goodea atripinnis TaxID=208336 RepID=A0ABV0Q335_9TELE
MNDGEKIPREDSLMLRSSSVLNETTGLWLEIPVLWLEKHKNTQRKKERSSEAAIVAAILVKGVLNVDYRLFTTILARRIAKILPYIISVDQTGFIKKVDKLIIISVEHYMSCSILRRKN